MMTNQLVLLSLLATRGAASIGQQVWPSTAFAPESAAAVSTPLTIDDTAVCTKLPCSVRFRGMVSLPYADLIKFSVVSDASVRLWVDDHLIVDDEGATSRTLLAQLNVSFLAGTAQKIRLDYRNSNPKAAAPTVILSWSGNTTAAGVVPGSALSSALPPGEAERIALSDRLLNPRVQWQTYDNPTMGEHVRMPQAAAVYATLGDLSDNKTLGDIIVFRRASPAVTFVGGHSFNGSDFTELTVSSWVGIQCDVTLSTSTSDDGLDLYFLAHANGTECGRVSLLVSFRMLWGRYGVVSFPSAGVARMVTPGFADTVIYAAGATAPWSGDDETWSFRLDAGPVGYSTGAAPVSVAAMAAAIEAARARQDAIIAAWGPELAPLYEPMASVIAWNTMFTPVRQEENSRTCVY
jgi:hypothetical protein